MQFWTKSFGWRSLPRVSILMKKELNLPSEKSNLLSGEQGFTMIEVLIGLGIALIGLLIFSTGVLSTLKSAEFLKSQSSREEISQSIRRAIIDRKALQKTILANPIFGTLATGSGPDVYSSVDYGIQILDASGMVISGAGADSTRLETPVYYTTEGYTCTTPAVAKCLIKVTSHFFIQGMPRYTSTDHMVPIDRYPAWNSALKPEFLVIKYRIEQLPSAHQIERKPIEGSVFLTFEDMEIL